MKQIHSMKNKDYSGDNYLANLKMCKNQGLQPWKGIIVRLGDKYTRLMNIAKSGDIAVKSETVADTFTDMAVYAILGRILYEQESGKVNLIKELRNAKKISKDKR